MTKKSSGPTTRQLVAKFLQSVEQRVSDPQEAAAVYRDILMDCFFFGELSLNTERQRYIDRLAETYNLPKVELGKDDPDDLIRTFQDFLDKKHEQ